MNTGRGAFGRIEAAFDRRAEKFTFRHPYLTILIMFIAVPLLMLAAVFGADTVGGFAGGDTVWIGWYKSIYGILTERVGCLMPILL